MKIRGRPLPLAVAALVGALLLSAPSSARATLQLKLTSNPTNAQVSDGGAGDLDLQSTNGQILYTNSNFNGLAITMMCATSTSGYDGPDVFSELSISSFTVKNNSRTTRTLTVALSDIGFDPNGPSRPLVIYNKGDALSSHLINVNMLYQTFVYDGSVDYGGAEPNTYFRTSGAGVTATDAVYLAGLATAGETSTLFYPTGAQFSMTGVMTITLAAGATFTNFGGNSLVHAPEPATVATALTGLPLLAFGWWRRRRSA